MKYIVRTFIFMCMLMTKIDCENKNARYNIEKQDKYRNFIESYLTDVYYGRVSYLREIEFEVFGKNDVVRPPDCSDRIPKAYPYWIPNTDCYALRLSSNETIILECISRKNQVKPGCFKMITPEGEETTICIRVLGDRCLGVITPQNLSVALKCYSSHMCYPNIQEIYKRRYAQLSAESYNLVPTTQRCYEVYGENQEISPYNCRKKSRPENYACIDLIPGKEQCLGLKTLKNETIEFVCGNSVENVFSRETRIQTKKCFNVHSPDGRTEKICQKKIGNYSIGITTPRNDSILLHSHFCRTYKTLDEIKTYREFLENFAFDPKIRSCYKVYNESQEVSPYTCLNGDVYDACVHQLEDNPNCIGITTQNNETVVLYCCSDSRKHDENAGCFKVITPYNTYSVCETKLDEGCVGIITPSNLKVLLECHTCTSPEGDILPSYRSAVRRTFRPLVEDAINRFIEGNYSFQVGTYVKVFGPQEDIREGDCYGRKYMIHVLYGHDNCIGITLANLETIVFDCPGKKRVNRGCFETYRPKIGSDNTVVGPDEKVGYSCVKPNNEKNAAIITPEKHKVVPAGLGNIVNAPPKVDVQPKRLG